MTISHEVTAGPKQTLVKSHTQAGSVQISYSAAVLQNLFGLLATLKDAAKYPFFRDNDLPPIYSLLDSIKPRKALRSYDSPLEKESDWQMLRHLMSLSKPLC